MKYPSTPKDAQHPNPAIYCLPLVAPAFWAVLLSAGLEKGPRETRTCTPKHSESVVGKESALHPTGPGQRSIAVAASTGGPERDRTMSTSSGVAESWISSFCSLLGHEYFAEVSEDFIEDDFNLTGLQSQVAMYKEALEVRSCRPKFVEKC